jgi:LPS export ABC transporter protein LptC
MKHSLMINHFTYGIKNIITTAITVVVVLFIAVSCTNNEVDKIGAVKDRSKMPKMRALEITTLISDSGITRYRISTPQWDVYDKANQPYWEFPMGIHFERFDANLKVDANIHSNYAKYLQNERLWFLKGNVKMMNIKGELFETERLYWDQQQEKIYSDTVVKITQATHIINAVGFEANQNMTWYTFKNTQGMFPVADTNM